MRAVCAGEVGEGAWEGWLWWVWGARVWPGAIWLGDGDDRRQRLSDLGSTLSRRGITMA